MPTTSLALITFANLVGIASLQAQMLTNPVQDFINKATVLNNILSNRRAIEMSQKMQTGEAAQKQTPNQPAAPDLTAFAYAGSPLMPKQLGAKGGPQAEQYFTTLISLYPFTSPFTG